MLQRARLLKAFAASGTKLVYGFLWQEETLEIPPAIVESQLVNKIGNYAIGLVNGVANLLNIFAGKPQYDNTFQVSRI